MTVKAARRGQGDTEAVPLVRAALEAGVGYLVLRDAVMRGLVVGWQDEKRHWFVDRSDLERFARERRRDRAAPQVAVAR